YFELTGLADTLPATANYHLTAKEHGDSIVFMYVVQAGPANQSYGLQVAKLAGVPGEVIKLAQEKLVQLELGSDRLPQQADMFAAPVTPEPEINPVEAALETVNADDLTPRDALQLIYQLKELIKK
ncbi:MAG: MutS-related protein, partial [Pseudomonadales bacterium]